MVNKLFVTKLSYKTTDESLEEVFKPFGKVIWCQVVKDRESGASKRFAFVQFEEDADAKTAMKELGEPVIDGCKVKIEWSHSGMPERRRSRSRSTSRPKSRGADRSKSPSAGRRGRSPMSRSPSEERRKKEKGDGDESCKEDGEKKENGKSEPEVRLFVGGLPDNCKEDDLMELFEDCEPTDAFVCRDKEPPCGFITLKDKKENVDKAFEKNNTYFMGSKWRLAVKDAKPQRDRGGRRSRSRSRGRGGRSRSRSRGRGGGGREVRLFVGGLPEDVTEKQVEELFKDCSVVEVFIPWDRQRGKPGPYFGFVSIRDEGDNLEQALKHDGGRLREDTEHRLAVAKSKPRRQDRSPPRRRRSPSPRYRRRSYSRGRSRSRSRGRYRSRSRSRDRRRRSRSYSRDRRDRRDRSRSRSRGRR